MSKTVVTSDFNTGKNLILIREIKNKSSLPSRRN